MPIFLCLSNTSTARPQSTLPPCAKNLPRDFPGVTFYFLPSDIVTQILNFGLPAPIDVQFEGSDLVGSRKIANNVLEQMRHVPA